MKKAFRYIGGFVFGVLPFLVHAQIGKEYSEVRVKGPVVQIQSTSSFFLFDDEGNEQSSMSNAATTLVDEGRMVKILFESEYSRSLGQSVVELEWEGDILRRIREYTERDGRPQKSLDKQYYPIYDGVGKMVTENIFYGEDDLRATLHYTHSESSAGNPVLQMTMYKPKEVEPQGHYYIEKDEWGEVLHIESVGQDTGLYNKRISSEGDSLFTMLSIVSSRQNRGAKDTFSIVTLNRYDNYGNQTFSKVVTRKLNGTLDGGKEMHMITEMNYIYEGEEVPDAEIEEEELAGHWVNTSYNTSLKLSATGAANNGIYTTSKLRDKDPEIVEDGTDWLFTLRNSELGTWAYDPATQIITFDQNGHVIATVKAATSLFRLILQGQAPYSPEIDFKKG